MAEQLTEQQRQAVYDRGGRLLVSAAAGSGKTKVLVDRLMSYLTDPQDPANIDDFLLITYTKAAAAELRGKIAVKLSQRVVQEPENRHLHRQIQRLYLTKISTVHAFCGDILREYAYRLNIPGDFRVADENECSEIRTRVMEKLLQRFYAEKAEDPAFCAFVDSQGLGRDDRQVPQIVLQVYDAARCHLMPGRWLEQCLRQIRQQEQTDAGSTVYGDFLIRRLHGWLELQAEAVGRCAQEAEAAGLTKPAALLRDTQLQLQALRGVQTWDQIRQNGRIDFGRLTYPRNFDDEDLKERIKAVRDTCKKEFEKRMEPFSDASEQVLADLAKTDMAAQGLVELVQAFSEEYDRAKNGRRVLDFGDLEHKMLDLLWGRDRSAPTAVAKEVGDRFREVMVDEYQDSNAVQDAIYAALTNQRKNLFMVGDVKQSIYQFRLADPGIFLEKYHRFVPAEQAEPGEDRKVILSKNFRSSGGVLEGCNDVFSLCMSPAVGGMEYGAEEALYEGCAHIPLPEPEVELHCIDVHRQTYPEEADYVAAHIQHFLQHGRVRQGEQLRPARPEDIAVLLRSPNTAGIYFQRALQRRGIRFATGGGIDLLQTEEVGTLYALLQAVHNPQLDIPLVAVLLSPVIGFTADDLAGLRGQHIRCSFFDALQQDKSEKSKAFVTLLQHLRHQMRHSSLVGLLEEILICTDFEEVYGAMDNGAMRRSNIQTFFQLACEQEAAGNRDLGRFLEHLQAMEEKGLLAAGEQSAPGCVTIMSIHKSKGLEFPVVYLCNLGKEFNMESKRGAVLCHKEMGLGLTVTDEKKRLRYPSVAKRAIAARIGEETLSEELRVLYVAMTRARDRLVMSYASNSLEKELKALTQRMNMGSGAMLTGEAPCPGRWVLLTALQKTEAGALFALGGQPRHSTSGDHPWKIVVGSAPQVQTAQTHQADEKPGFDLEFFQQIRNGLAFSYPHLSAVHAPSKLTATALKGRYKDEEATQLAPKPPLRRWREGAFGSPSGKDHGTAIHAVMQYIDYAACQSLAAVTEQIRHLQEARFISEEQAQLVRPEMIYDFFRTELGQKLRQGHVLREFKFSILQDAAQLDPALAGEQVLLQGVVDCALIEEDGITVIDFKTDQVTAETLDAKASTYAPQVCTYAQALERIYQQRVKKRLLYFFRLGKFVRV